MFIASINNYNAILHHLPGNYLALMTKWVFRGIKPKNQVLNFFSGGSFQIQPMTEEIKVLIVEDEKMWSKTLANILNDFGYTIAGIADKFEAALTMLNTADYDIVLQDIHLNKKSSGIEIGKMISHIYKKPFIFITSSTEPEILAAAVSAGPSAYLTKPVHQASLIATIQSAINNFNERISPAYTPALPDNDIFFVKQGAKYKKLNWTNIVYLRSDKNYTIAFNAPDQTDYFIRSSLAKTMNFIIPNYLQPSFVQINRAEAVQIPFIQELAAYELKTTHKTLSVSDMYIADLKKAMKIVM